ncbi:uncharacterized protein LOC144106847 isoform X2 [Amblyomma americanum]
MATRTSLLVVSLCSLFTGVVTAKGGFRTTHCNIEKAYHCYHNVSKTFVTDRLLPAYPDDGSVFGDICAKKEQFLLRSKCKDFYSGCFENDKRRFQIQEQGYAFLQRFSTDLITCSAPGFLRICVDTDVMKKCTLERPREYEDLYVFRKKSYALIQDLTACVEKAVAKCDNIQAERINTLNLVLIAASELNWFDDAVEPEPTTDAPTTVDTTEGTSSTGLNDESVATSAGTAESTKGWEPTSEASSVDTSAEHSTTPSEAATEAVTANTMGPHSGASNVNAIGVLFFLILGLLRL